MNKENNIYFKETLRGYSKADVNQYIEQMNLRFTELENEYRNKNARQKEQIEELKNLLASAVPSDGGDGGKDDGEAENLRRERDEAISGLKRCEALTAAQNETIENQKNEIKTLEARLNEQKTVADDLKAQLAENTDGSDEIKKKAALYDGMSAKFGDILIRTNKLAESIVIDAQSERQKIIGTESVRLGEVAAEIEKRLRESVLSFTDDYKKALVRVKASIDSVITELETCSRDTLTNYRKISDELLNALAPAELDQNYPDGENGGQDNESQPDLRKI